MQNRNWLVGHGIGQFLSAAIFLGAVVSASLFWNQRRAITSIIVTGFERTASSFRDSVNYALSSLIERTQAVRLGDVEKCVQAFAFLKSATARRDGYTVVVSVAERIPSALVSLPNRRIYWLSEEGELYHYDNYYTSVNVPIVIAPDTMHIADVHRIVKRMHQYRHTYTACSELVFSSDRNITATLNPWNIQVQLGRAEALERKLISLEWLLQNLVMGTSVGSIDLRWEGRIVVRVQMSETAQKVL